MYHITAMKIQITEECRNALTDLGGYVIECRGIIEVKVNFLQITVI